MNNPYTYVKVFAGLAIVGLAAALLSDLWVAILLAVVAVVLLGSLVPTPRR
jgi:hypothetical protein